MNKPQTKKVWTPKQYSSASAICLLLFIVAVGILIGAGDLQGVSQIIIAFILGAACASYGARGRSQ